MSPVAGPLASSAGAQNAPTRRGSGPLAPTKDLRPRRRMSPRRLASISQQLSQRDLEALRTVGRFRVMSGGQLQRLLWREGSPQTAARLARRGLSRLVRLDVLQPLARRVGGMRAGSASTTFAVGRAGQYLLQSEQPSKRRVRRAHTPGERYLAHTLAVAGLYVDLVEAQRRELVEVLAFDPEPECWRPYMAAFAARRVLKPDAFLKLAIGEYDYSWLVEQDMATEAQPTIESKARRYYDYYRSGREQAARGVFPRVLWIVPDPSRAETVRETLGRLPADARRLFAVTTAADALVLLTTEARS
jgi:Replication-relaxation